MKIKGGDSAAGSAESRNINVIRQDIIGFLNNISKVNSGGRNEDT